MSKTLTVSVSRKVRINLDALSEPLAEHQKETLAYLSKIYSPQRLRDNIEVLRSVGIKQKDVVQALELSGRTLRSWKQTTAASNPYYLLMIEKWAELVRDEVSRIEQSGLQPSVRVLPHG